MISFEYLLLEYFYAEGSAEILQTENIVISRLKIVILIFSIYGERPLPTWTTQSNSKEISTTSKHGKDTSSRKESRQDP